MKEDEKIVIEKGDKPGMGRRDFIKGTAVTMATLSISQRPG